MGRPKGSTNAPKQTTKKVSATVNKPRTYILTRGMTPVSYILKTSNIFITDENGQEAEIKYVAGETSIYVRDHADKKRKSTEVVIEDGQITIPPSKTLLQSFIDAHPENEENGGAGFREYDTEKEAQNEVDKDDLIMDVKSTIREMMESEEGLAKLESINRIKYGEGAITATEIKRNLYDFASTDPSGLMEMLDDPKMEAQDIALKAKSIGIIDVDEDLCRVKWADTNATIFTGAVGKDPIDTFSLWLISDKGIQTKDELTRKLEEVTV